MISFRYHVVSITAVFLAIAIGVVVGSTYVDRAVVENLERRIDSVSRNLDERKQANDRLEGELGDVRDYVTASADFAVTDRLIDVPVLLLAFRGVDEDAVRDLGLLTRRSGGVVPGVVWVETKWALGSDDDRAALANAIGADERTPVARLRDQAWEAVVAELSSTPAAGGSTTTTVAPLDVLAPLQASGFLTVDALDDASVTLARLRGASPRVLVLTGSSEDERLERIAAKVIAAPVAGGLATVVAEVYAEERDGPARGEALAASVPEDLRDRVVLIDHADRSEGRVAAVISLAAISRGLVGHFGYGSGADGVIPGWTPP
jgi:hypothetical protein